MRNDTTSSSLCVEVLAKSQFSTFHTLAFFVHTRGGIVHSLYPIGFRKGRLVVCGDPVAVETISHRKSDGRAYKRKRRGVCRAGETA